MALSLASSPSLVLTHPTPLEITRTHHHSSEVWASPLTKEQYIENEDRLAAHLGITHWILASKTDVPNERPVLASCETIRKRCLVRDEKEGGEVRGSVVIAVAAVFCERAFRGRGYVGRMFGELKDVLEREKGGKGVGSVLWSDIGPKYYAELGWKPFPSSHIEMPASVSSGSSQATMRAIQAENMAGLCTEDEALLRASTASALSSKLLFAIVPDHQTILWHHRKEEYICEKLFEKRPVIKGAVAGEAGKRIWVIWTRAFYGALENPVAGNRLYILRLVVENPGSEDEAGQIEHLEAVLKTAQAEALEWQLPVVELWNPDARTKYLIQRTGIEYRTVERKIEGIPSLLWFGDEIGNQLDLQWTASEKFAWC